MAFQQYYWHCSFVTMFDPGLYSAITGVGLSTVPRFARLVRDRSYEYKRKGICGGASSYRTNKTCGFCLKHILLTALA